jgi:hypothetical protein
MRQQDFRANLPKHKAVTTSFNQELFILKRYLLLIALGLLIISMSSFETISEKEDAEISKVVNVEQIENSCTEVQEEHDLVNTFLDYIPGLREYLFRFKKTDLKKTC